MRFFLIALYLVNGISGQRDPLVKGTLWSMEPLVKGTLWSKNLWPMVTLVKGTLWRLVIGTLVRIPLVNGTLVKGSTPKFLVYLVQSNMTMKIRDALTTTAPIALDRQTYGQA